MKILITEQAPGNDDPVHTDIEDADGAGSPVIVTTVETCASKICTSGKSCLLNDHGLPGCYPDEIEGAPAPWWNQVSQSFQGENLKMCFNRNGVAPAEGSLCSKKTKTCYFGRQACAASGQIQPTKHCLCRGKTWSCEEIGCVTIFG